MSIQKAIHSKSGKIVISLVLGFGLATLFRKVCHDRTCLHFSAVSNDKIKNKIFKFNNKCYTFKENAVSCNASKKILSV